MKRSVRVVAALLERDDRVLVQQRPEGKARALLWEFPGGKVEAGETEQQALERECAEELGVQVTAGAVLWRTRHAYADLEVELVLVAAQLVAGGEPAAHDAHRIAWVERAALSALPFCEADLPFVEKLARGEL